jgi:hypothetical protein
LQDSWVPGVARLPLLHIVWCPRFVLQLLRHQLLHVMNLSRSCCQIFVLLCCSISFAKVAGGREIVVDQKTLEVFFSIKSFGNIPFLNFPTASPSQHTIRPLEHCQLQLRQAPTRLRWCDTKRVCHESCATLLQKHCRDVSCLGQTVHVAPALRASVFDKLLACSTYLRW